LPFCHLYINLYLFPVTIFSSFVTLFSLPIYLFGIPTSYGIITENK
jgi:hypothetical protein